MNLNAIYVLWLREIKMFLRFKTRMIGLFVLVILSLFIFGSGFGDSFKIAGLAYSQFIIAGVIGFMIIFTSFLSGISIINDRRFGFLREILVAPISTNTIIIGKTLGGTTVSVLRALIMLIALALIGIIEIQNPNRIFLCILSMTFISASFVSLGVAFSSLMSDTEGFLTFFNFLILPIFAFSGGLYSVDTVNPWIKIITCLNPLTYGLDLLRYFLIQISAFSIWLDFIVLISFTIITIIMGRYLFHRSLL